MTLCKTIKPKEGRKLCSIKSLPSASSFKEEGESASVNIKQTLAVRENTYRDEGEREEVLFSIRTWIYRKWSDEENREKEGDDASRRLRAAGE